MNTHIQLHQPAIDVQIVSASDFMGAGRLYTEYALCLPRNWTMAAEEGGEAVGGGEKRGGAGHQVEGLDGVDGDFAAGGTTQVTAGAHTGCVSAYVVGGSCHRDRGWCGRGTTRARVLK